MKSLLCLIIIFPLWVSCAWAQNTIKGTVTDALTKEPLTGAAISSPTTHTSAITDINGRFILNTTNKADSVVVTYPGYATQIIAVKSDVINVHLNAAQSDMNEVIVTANRERQARTEAPEAISVLSNTTIQDTKATQLDQLLNQVAGVYMVDLGNQQHAMAIRQPLGYNNYFLYMEDGIPIRVEGDFNHNALIEINDAALDRVEIVRGPASSLYGSEAVGGAVNFITQAPSLTPTAKVEAELGNYGYNRANFFASTTVNKLGLYIGGYYADRNVAIDQYDNFHKLALNFRADYAFNEHTKLIITAADINYYTDQKGGLDSAQFFDKNYTNNPISNQRFTYRKVDAFRARATLQHEWNRNSNTEFTAYYRNNSIGQNPFYDEVHTANPLKSTGQINVDAFTSYGAIIQHTRKFNWLNAKWITGISADISPETYNARYIIDSMDANQPSVYYSYKPTDSMLTKYSATLYNTAIYTQFEFNPLTRLRVVAGIRYDRLDYNFTNYLAPSAFTGPADTTNHFDHVTPRVGLTYSVNKNIGLYVNYSIGFAPPNITDLYSGYTIPDLKPSTFYNYEVGGWMNVADHGYLELSLYQLDGVNEIVSVIQPNGTSLNENAGKTQHTGAELSFNYNLTRNLFFRASATYVQHKYIDFTDGKTNVDNNMMADAPPYIINSQLVYKPVYLKGFLLSFEWQSVAAYYTDPENQHKYDGYNTFNLRTAYNYKHFEVWANCMNLTNKVYATIVTYGYGQNTYYPGMLRTFNLGIGYTFTKKNS